MVMTIVDDDVAVGLGNKDDNDYDDKGCITIPIVQKMGEGGVNGCTVGIVLHPQ